MNPTKITENQDKAQSVNGSRFVRYNGKCVTCNAKCETSRAHVCECSCGGKNHGSHAGW